MSAMLRFHEECFKSLTEPEPGSGLLVRPRETDEIMRSAGKLFMDTPAQDLGMNPAATKLFATCNTISSLRYEGAEGVGKMLLARRGHPNLSEVFALTCPTPLTDYRAVRKLLEMTTPDVSLLADGENVYALGRQIGQYDATREDLFVINFVTHYAWEFQHGGQVLMRAHYGQPSLPRTRLNRAKFRRDLKRTFQLTDAGQNRDASGTWCSKPAARSMAPCSSSPPKPWPKPTASSCSARSSSRYRSRHSSPASSPPSTAPCSSTRKAFCYSIGVILDGKASGHGTSTRGARYNSAIRYVDSSPYPCLAIVVSEDGLVDVITKESLREE